MMWSVVILLAAALGVASYTVHDTRERLAHGRQLKIYLPKAAEKLEFIPANNPSGTRVYWENGRHRINKGRVSGSDNERRWYIDKVTYADEGTYTQKDYWGKEVSSVKVAVTLRRNYVQCVAGDSLYIQLEGIDLSDAALNFTGEDRNVTLVHDGALLSQDLPDYWDRVRTSAMSIEIKNVNYSDVGHYTLRNRVGRVVSVTRMDLTDKRETNGNPLLALLVLLGIPAGICCCCRKKIFKKKATTAATLQPAPVAIHPPPGGPVGPCPPYNTPGQPGVAYYHGPDPNMGPTFHPTPPTAGPGQWNGPPPSPGFNPAYPPQNAAYPPAVNPQPPQWNGPPPVGYPTGPAAPMGYAPAVYSSAPPASSGPAGKVRMENMGSSPADQLLTPTQQAEAASSPVPPPSSSSNMLSTDNAYEFKIDGEKSTNFL